MRELYKIAKRADNPKRNNIFISTVVGNHWIIRPSDMLNIAAELGALAPELPQNTLVIGLSEATTALGKQVAMCLNRPYMATTRCLLDNPISFTEGHSLTPNHNLNKSFIQNTRWDAIVFVEDEISTGKSMRDLIALMARETSCKTFTVLTILDWQNTKNQNKNKELCDTLGISIQYRSILNGHLPEIPFPRDVVYHNTTLQNVPLQPTTLIPVDFVSDYMGKSQADLAQDKNKVLEYSEYLKKVLDKNTRYLVNSEGEEMWFPLSVAHVLETKGYDVKFFNSSKTPLFIDGDIYTHAVTFERGSSTLFNQLPRSCNRTILYLTRFDTAPAIRENQLSFKF